MNAKEARDQLEQQTQNYWNSVDVSAVLTDIYDKIDREIRKRGNDITRGTDILYQFDTIDIKDRVVYKLQEQGFVISPAFRDDDYDQTSPKHKAVKISW